MAVVAGSLHDWLAASAYVWGNDQTAAVVGRKKCRAHRKGATAGDGHGRTLDLPRGPKISNRRYRRWLNDQLLKDLAPPLDAADIESLFAPPPWGEQRVVTPLERVIGGGATGAFDMVEWEPFRNIDMDKQDNWIRHAEKSKTTKASSGPGKRLAMEAWQGMERSVREALRRNSQSPLLQAFEEKILVFLSDIGVQGEDQELAVEAETSYHRLLLYGLTQFHGLVSRRVCFDSNGKGRTSVPCENLIMIKRRDIAKSKESSGSPEEQLNLVEFLRGIQLHSWTS